MQRLIISAAEFDLWRIGPRQQESLSGRPGVTKARRLERIRFTILPREGEGKSGASWEDTEKDRVEHHLRDMLVALIVEGEANYRSRAYASYEWRLKQRAELEAELRRRRAEGEKRERERLAQ